MTRMGASLNRTRGALVAVTLFAVFSIVLTMMVAGTLQHGALGDTHGYLARFADVDGLQTGDDVRIAGVRVGQVTSIDLSGKTALVGFDVETDEHVFANTAANLDYLNLMGQRYIALRNPSAPGRVLAPGSTIGLDRTSVGLDLTAMFNAFRPLFTLIKPGEVNALAADIVQIFQGEGGALQDLVNQTARITSTLADRDQVIGAVITNVNAVMQTVDDQHTQIASIVRRLDTLTTKVADHAGEVAETITSAQSLVTSVASLMRVIREPLTGDIASLAAWAGSFVAQTPRLAAALHDTQTLLITYIKTLGLGSYLNTYVCKSTFQVGNARIPLVASSKHSERCP